MKKITPLLLLISSLSFSQVVTFKNEAHLDKVFNTSDITWFGLDFSQCRITNPDKMFQGQEIASKYPPLWMNQINKNFDLGYIQNKLDNKNIKADLVSVQKLYNSINKDSFVVAQHYSIQWNKIVDDIKSYNLPQKSGVGLVFIPTNFDELDKHAHGYFVFFDIENRDILAYAEVSGLRNGKGFGNVWYGGLAMDMKHYFKYISSANDGHTKMEAEKATTVENKNK